MFNLAIEFFPEKKLSPVFRRFLAANDHRHRRQPANAFMSLKRAGFVTPRPPGLALYKTDLG